MVFEAFFAAGCQIITLRACSSDTGRCPCYYYGWVQITIANSLFTSTKICTMQATMWSLILCSTYPVYNQIVEGRAEKLDRLTNQFTLRYVSMYHIWISKEDLAARGKKGFKYHICFPLIHLVKSNFWAFILTEKNHFKN